MTITVKQFKSIYKGGFMIYAADDLGDVKKGDWIWKNVDDLTVINWAYNPLNGIYYLTAK